MKINQAYEILKDEHLRKSYDYYLENPHKSKVSNYYRYYKAKYTPKHDPINVTILILLAFTVLIYIIEYQMYESCVKQISLSNNFKKKVTEVYA